MDIVATLVLTMSVTFYLPDAGGINGDRHMADGSEAHIGFAACGSRYPFGTVFEIMVDMSEFGVPQTVECRDRGGAVGPYNLDLVMRTGNLETDWKLARAWGKRRVPVRVWRDWGHYVDGITAEARLAEAQAETATIDHPAAVKADEESDRVTVTTLP
jgi:hypothetical protein